MILTSPGSPDRKKRPPICSSPRSVVLPANMDGHCHPEPYGKLRINSMKGLGLGGVNAPPQILHPAKSGFRMTLSYLFYDTEGPLP